MEGTPLRRFPRYLLVLLGAVALVACLDDGDDSPRLEDGAPLPALFGPRVVIDQGNATTVAAAVHGMVGPEVVEQPVTLQQLRASGLGPAAARELAMTRLERWPAHPQLQAAANGTVTIPCEVSGSTTVTVTDTSLLFTFHQCDDGDGLIMDGQFNIRDIVVTSPAPGVEHGSATVEFIGLRITEPGFPPLITNGALGLEWQEDGNLFHSRERMTGELVMEMANVFAGFADADILTVENWTAGWAHLLDWERSIARLVVANSDLNGHVEAVTTAPVGGDAFEPCPLRGVVRAAGAEDSVLEIHYGSDASGVVDIHLNGAVHASYPSCAAFLEAIGALPTVPPPVP